MSGCFPTHTVGNLAFAPSLGGSCGCPCHLYNGSPCWCSCPSPHPKFDLIVDNSMALTLKSMQLQVDVLRRTVEQLEKCIKSKPHKCPVCDGKCGGRMEIDKDLETLFIDCLACKGKGIVWITTTEELIPLHR